MKRLRKVRRDFREGVLKLAAGGRATHANMWQLAEELFEDEVSAKELFRSLFRAEIANCQATLTQQGHVISADGSLVLKGQAQPEQIEQVSSRRWKRVRGELRAEEKLCHETGRVVEAAQAATLLQVLNTTHAESADTPAAEAVPVA